MQLQLNPSGEENVVQSVRAGRVWISGNEFDSSLILGPQHLDPAWNVKSVEQLTQADARPLLDLRPELLILGTGNQLQFPDRTFSNAFASESVGCEVMDTLAACRTYNVLVAEGRNVFAALIIDPAGSAEGLPGHR